MNNNIEQVERIAFRLKDLLTVIQDKETIIRVYSKEDGQKEIDYLMISEYMNDFVYNIGIGTEMNDGEGKPCISICVAKTIEFIYVPYI